MKELFQAAGIPLENRNITNHSGKVTCCTTLFNAGFSLKVFCETCLPLEYVANIYQKLLQYILD
jgi:hypothetical protein